MLPYFKFFWIKIYTFWFTLIIIFFLFYWMLRKLSIRNKFDFEIFRTNIFWFFISTFLFSRIFYVISQWNDAKFINWPIEFFFTLDYNFSLYWAIFWFFLILFIILKSRKENIIKYIDWIILSFYFVLFVWFFWAFLWWQVYWIPTNFWIEISYWSAWLIPYYVPIFPLPIVYTIISFLIFCILYIMKMFIKTNWLIWYLWLWLLAIMTIILEFFNWKSDILNNFIFNFNQICAIFVLIFSWLILKNILRRSKFEWTTNILDKE